MIGWLGRAVDGLGRDLGQAVKQLRRSPGFAAAAVVSLALGIGANTAIFSLLDQVLVRNLPVREPGRLVRLAWKGGARYGVDIGSSSFSYPMYRDFIAGNRVFSGMLCRFSLSLSVGYA